MPLLQLYDSPHQQCLTVLKINLPKADFYLNLALGGCNFGGLELHIWSVSRGEPLISSPLM